MRRIRMVMCDVAPELGFMIVIVTLGCTFLRRILTLEMTEPKCIFSVALPGKPWNSPPTVKSLRSNKKHDFSRLQWLSVVIAPVWRRRRDLSDLRTCVGDRVPHLSLERRPHLLGPPNS